jgi:Zn-dependent protease with chaperone function
VTTWECEVYLRQGIVQSLFGPALEVQLSWTQTHSKWIRPLQISAHAAPDDLPNRQAQRLDDLRTARHRASPALSTLVRLPARSPTPPSGLEPDGDNMFDKRSFSPAYVTGWMAASLLSVSLGLGISSKFKTSRRLHELTVEPFVGTHVPTPDFDLVLLPSQARLAYSRQAARPQVVITEGLLQLLSEEEFRILLRHEAAHLRYHHERELQALAVLRFALSWLPGINGSVSIARLAMERLADEEAAGAGRPLRTALARALLVTVSGAAPDAVPAFNHAQGLVERVQAMRTTAAPLKRYQEIGLKFAATFMRASVSAGGLLGVLLMTGVCLR